MENTNDVKKVKVSTVYGEMHDNNGNNDRTETGKRKVVNVNSLYPTKMMKEVDKNV